jgi:hypothetical protein
MFAGQATSLAVTKKMPGDVRTGYLAPYNNWHNRIAIHRFVQDIPWEDDHPTRPLLAQIDAEIGQFKEHPNADYLGSQRFCIYRKRILTRNGERSVPELPKRICCPTPVTMCLKMRQNRLFP